MNISYLINFLWRKKWIILIPTLLALIIAWTLSLRTKSSYTSEAEISTGFMDLNPLENPNQNPNNIVLFNNVIQTLKSNHVINQITYKLLLHDLQGNTRFRKPSDESRFNQILKEFQGGKAGLTSILNNKIDSFSVLNLANKNDRMIQELSGLFGYTSDDILGNTEIKRIEGSNFISITSTTNDPNLSAFIPNSVCRTFLMYYQTMQGLASTMSLDTLKSIVNTKKMILDNKLKLSQVGNDFTVSSSIGILGNLQELLTEQKNNLISAQVALENVSKQITDNDKKGGLSANEEIIALRANIDNLWAKYVNGGSNDASLLDQINKLRNTLQQKLSVIGNTNAGVNLGDLVKQKMDLEIKVNVAKQTMKDLEGKISTLTGTVQSSASQDAIISGEKNEIEIARQEYVNANNLYNDALNRNLFPGNNFKQTLIASPPLYPNSSSKLKVIGFAGAGVFCILIFVLLFFEFLDPSIKAPSYLKENIQIPLLTSLQRIIIGEKPIVDILKPTDTANHAKKAYREQIKQLRFEIENSGKKIFIIMGYHISSGRTTLIQLLGASLSLTGKKVLLIDSNFQNNTLTRLYNADGVLESFELNGNENQLKQKIKNIATQTESEYIQIVGCKGGDYTPAEVLPSKNLLSSLKNQDTGYDYIFIDCTSLSRGPDCKEVLKYADSVILLFAADQALTEEDKKLADYLKSNNAHILGTVLNKVNSYSMNL